VDLPLQRNNIAGYHGLTFETVSRILGTRKDLEPDPAGGRWEVSLLDTNRRCERCG
jgi:hypothetical protein